MRTVRQLDKLAPEHALVQTQVPVPSDPTDVLVRVAATALCYGDLTGVSRNPQFFPPPTRSPCQARTSRAPLSRSAPGPRPRLSRATRSFTESTQRGRVACATTRSPWSRSWPSSRRARTGSPPSALTAWQALFVHGSLEQSALFGDAAARQRNSARRVLVTAGGVGAIVGVCSTDKLPQVQHLGATAVIDYRKQEIGAWVGESPREREFDLVPDCVGGGSMMGLWTAVRDGDEFISVCDMPDRLRPEGVTKTLKKSEFFNVSSLGSQLADVSRLLEEGRVKPLVDSVYAFEDYQEAFDKLD